MNNKERIESEKNALANIQDEIHEIIMTDMKARATISFDEPRARISSDQQWQEQKEREIEQIMEDIENAQGPQADQEALYERAWEEWEERNETREG